MGKVAKDKWDKVIEYLTHSDRDPQKVLKLLKGCDQGKESNYDINRASYSLNIIAIVTQKQLDPENKDKSLTHTIRQWVKSKDFIKLGVGFNKTTGVNFLEEDRKKIEELRPKAKIIEKTFDRIKKNERQSRKIVS